MEGGPPGPRLAPRPAFLSPAREAGPGASRGPGGPPSSKTIILTLVVVFSNVIGNFSLSRGMRGTDPAAFRSALGYLEPLFNPWVALGVSLLVMWMLSQMLLLSWADLSYVLPVTSIGYVLTAVAGRVILHEQISPARWAGVTLIMAGVALVGRTAHNTTGL